MASLSENKLKQAGLSGWEARVYLASLESGPNTVMNLAKHAKIKRPTCYVMIESLIQKGLMSFFVKGKKRYFSAVNPEKLTDLITVEKEGLAAREDVLINILPELISLFNISERKPQVSFFEGKEGVRSIQRDILKSKPRSIYSFVPLDPAHELFPPSSGDLREKMIKIKGLRMKTIYTSKKGTKLPERTDAAHNKFVDPDKFPFSTEVVIYNDKVAFLSFKDEIIGVIIESKQIADTMRSIFELSWA